MSDANTTLFLLAHRIKSKPKSEYIDSEFVNTENYYQIWKKHDDWHHWSSHDNFGAAFTYKSPGVYTWDCYSLFETKEEALNWCVKHWMENREV